MSTVFQPLPTLVPFSLIITKELLISECIPYPLEFCTKYRELCHDITVHVVPPCIVYDSLMGPSSSSCMYLQCPCLALTIIQKDKRTSSTHFVNKVILDSFKSFFSFFCYVRGNRTLYHNSNSLIILSSFII